MLGNIYIYTFKTGFRTDRKLRLFWFYSISPYTSLRYYVQHYFKLGEIRNNLSVNARETQFKQKYTQRK